MLIKVLDIKAVMPATLSVTFSDGLEGSIDLSELIERGGAMVAPLAQPDYFARVFLEAGAPTWPNGFDLAPWALHDDMKRLGLLSPSGEAA